ncbi:MAG TPA: glycosyltransferase family 4 protein [Candidatus Saccharimonadales bacterium]|nr:glycosyltransferase family 4 protein [Candidatus Saccharimonadales bacterium]
MKIGLVCPYNIARGGGVQEHVRDLLKEIKHHGHEAKIITPQPRDGSGLAADEILYLGGATDFRSPTHTSLQVSASVDPETISRILEQEAFDILHFHEPWIPVLSRQILSRSTSVNIATFHAKIPETLMSRTVVRVVTPYMKSVLKYIHEFTAVSDSAAEYVRSLSDAPITIIPNGVDLSRYHVTAAKKSADSSPTKTIFYIGRLERRKGLKYLLRAYQLLAQEEPNVALIIAGDGPDREKLELLAEDLKLPNVSFLGYISEEQKMQLLARSDLFCSPAVYGESFGIVLLEAMACGLVTVAGNNSGYTDVMKDLGAVSIVNPHDEVEFARRLGLLLNETRLRGLWKDWAAEYVKQFDFPKVAENYLNFYNEALKRHRP